MSFLLIHLMKILIPFKNTNMFPKIKIIYLADKLMAAFTCRTHPKKGLLIKIVEDCIAMKWRRR